MLFLRRPFHGTPFSAMFFPALVQEKEQVQDHHPLAFVHVKATGILKVRQGQSLQSVAKSGLLTSHRCETVKALIHSVCFCPDS
jgi:hypothetical protein